MKRQETDKRNLCPEWVRRMLGESDDSFGIGLPWGLELRGGLRLNLSGCRRILHYSDALIGLSVKQGELWIYGKRLSCVSYCPATVGIEGEIYGLSIGDMGEGPRFLSTSACAEGGEK